MAKNVLICASFGGHWTQVTRIASGFLGNHNIFYATTSEGALQSTESKRFNYLLLNDVNKNNLLGLFRNLFLSVKFIANEKVDIIISTGALPGLICCFSGFLMGRKTIWIDSIANVNKISLSGRVAKLFCSKVLTQWPHLTSDRIEYKGRVL